MNDQVLNQVKDVNIKEEEFIPVEKLDDYNYDACEIVIISADQDNRHRK